MCTREHVIMISKISSCDDLKDVDSTSEKVFEKKDIIIFEDVVMIHEKVFQCHTKGILRTCHHVYSRRCLRCI